jgi:ADP-heptose:LPS heptosyltransferase
VLIVASSHVGRNLFCTPALRLIRRRWPGARVRVLAGSWRGAAVLRGNPDVDEIRVIVHPLQVLGHAWGAEGVIGFSRRWLPPFVAARIPRPVIVTTRRAHHHADEALRSVSDALHVQIDAEDRHYVLVPGPRAYAHAARLVGRPGAHRLIGLHLGSGRTYHLGRHFWEATREADERLWGVSNYVDLAHRLVNRDPRTRVVLTGAASERFLARRFLRAVPDALDLVGRTSIAELAATMTHLSAFVTQDTGPLHIAAAMDTPLVAIFGPTDPARTGPYPEGGRHRLLRGCETSAVDCRAVAEAVEEIAR